MIQLVEDAKQSWKWFSIQAMTIAAALQGTWVTLPEDLKSHVPTNAVHYATLALVIAGIIGRLVNQKT
jgi:hypothetical protein